MDLSDAYENGAYIPEAAQYPARWASEAAAFRAQLGDRAQLNLPYGEGARHRLDLFMPEAEPLGLVVFVHGGYWRRFDRSDWSHLARGALARRWAVAMPSYDLCPDVRIAGITQQVARAVGVAAELVAGPIRICGHSAGGHLTARMAAALPDDLRGRVAAFLPISPLSDLTPLMQTAMNADLRLDAAEAEAESPVNDPAPNVPVTVWVGGAERPAFLDQAQWLGDTWGCRVVIDEGRHHFDVIDGLRDPDSAMMRQLIGV